MSIAIPPTQLATVDNRLVAANTQFSFKLFDKIVKQDAGKNIFISPASVTMALAMIYNGAGGGTQEAMARALALQGMSLPEINQAQAALRAMLARTDPNVQLTIANSLWAGKGVAFKTEFLKRNQDFFAAKITNLDFATPGAAATMNEWVNQQTNGKINKIVDTIPGETILYLINAIYFKGRWSTQFDKAKTKDGQFTLLNGAKKKHPMMSQSGRFPYYENEKFQAISLPYGDGRVSLYVFLPNKNSNLNALQAELSAEKWESWMPQFRSTEGNITLPRLKLEYEMVLNNALKTLGMEAAFDPQRANFAAMCSTSPGANVFLGEVKHKTFVDVNEEGTEAAAVTSGGMRVTAFIPPFTMIVDRPFFSAIRDNQTGTILFIGSIVEPR
ncbi:MAG: serpin family protein [candidate division KSB1 bacterium]|nr:serpin family protein [candidate division KSB1 bacterium]MDZ7369138.1 serpin family protein [candidate division KSB1 bacterium]MDZ7407099.1 serpin family protein [candidate division KSB1 bacterium]